MPSRARLLSFALLALLAAAPAARAAIPSRAEVVRDGGAVRFAGSPPGRPLTAAAPSADVAARAFLEGNAADFGLGRAASLRRTRSEAQPGGGHAVRFQQAIDGVEVLGGEFVVSLDERNRVLSVMGEAQPGTVGTRPRITRARAEAEAIRSAARREGVGAATLEARHAELKIFNDEILGGPRGDRPRLVWAVEAGDGGTVRRLVLVDAQRGFAVTSIQMNPDARDRTVCDGGNVREAQTDCTAPVLTESGTPNHPLSDVNDAFVYTGATYDYLLAAFGRDSLDGAGMTLKSTVRYCPPLGQGTCPYFNASWNGKQMIYGEGFAAADDVVAHELAHGLTDHTSGLLYYFQAGAINESMSDVFGELIDQITASPDDAPADRWLIAETLGTFRSMADPTAYNNADRVLSPLWELDLAEGDHGGVHFNSGVGNKAAYLMTDGGTFNGFTVTGLGPAKVGQLYYRVQTAFLSSGSDYRDLGLALGAACDQLTGAHGITAADCAEVRDAVLATEMLSDRPEAADMAPCGPGLAPEFSFLDRIDSSGFGWEVVTDANPLLSWGLDNAYATSGEYSLYVPDFDVEVDTSVRQTDAHTIPAGSFLRFSQAYDFQAGMDGGVVEVSTNGGASWTELVPAADQPAFYTHLLSGTGALSGRRAISGKSSGFRTAVVSLAALAGQSARFAFRIATDDAIGGSGYLNGWEIDDVGVFTCVTATPPAAVTGAPAAISDTGATVGGTVDPNGLATTYRVKYGKDGVLDRLTPEASAGSGADPVAVSAALTGLLPSTSYSFQIIATNAAGTALSTPATFSTAATPVPVVDPPAGAGTPPTGGGATNPPVTTALPPASLRGTATALKKRVRAARVVCANAATGVACKVTFPGARRKRKVSATLKLGSATVARGSVRKASAAGLVTIKGAKPLRTGAYALSIKVGRTTYRFKVTLA